MLDDQALITDRSSVSYLGHHVQTGSGMHPVSYVMDNVGAGLATTRLHMCRFLCAVLHLHSLMARCVHAGAAFLCVRRLVDWGNFLICES